MCVEVFPASGLVGQHLCLGSWLSCDGLLGRLDLLDLNLILAIIRITVQPEVAHIPRRIQLLSIWAASHHKPSSVSTRFILAVLQGVAPQVFDEFFLALFSLDDHMDLELLFIPLSGEHLSIAADELHKAEGVVALDVLDDIVRAEVLLCALKGLSLALRLALGLSLGLGHCLGTLVVILLRFVVIIVARVVLAKREVECDVVALGHLVCSVGEYYFLCSVLEGYEINSNSSFFCQMRL